MELPQLLCHLLQHVVLLSLCGGGGVIGLVDGGVIFILEGEGIDHRGPIARLDYVITFSVKAQ